MRHALCSIVLVSLFLGCSDTTTTSSDLRDISNQEARADFEQLAGAFRSLYGALERKEARYGFDFEERVGEYRARVAGASTEREYRALFAEFIALFRDAHVSLGSLVSSDGTIEHVLPLSVMPIEDSYVVYASSIDGIARGDELLSVDGIKAADFVDSVLKYAGYPHRDTAKHFGAKWLTERPLYMAIPEATARVRLRNAAGVEVEMDLPWSEKEDVLPKRTPAMGSTEVMAVSDSAAAVINAELRSFNVNQPFFMTPEVMQALDVQQVNLPDETLTQFGIDRSMVELIGYFAATYRTHGKTVLLVRLPNYMPLNMSGSIALLHALFSYHHDKADVLVVDQTHNAGGNIMFAEQVVAMLAKRPIRRVVQRMHADREWIGNYARAADAIKAHNTEMADKVLADARVIEEAYDTGEPLSPPLLFLHAQWQATLDPDPQGWKKPVLVLADELSVSSADLVPLLVQANGIGKVFGATTMGGGGNVEAVLTLSATRATLNLSRGLFTVYDPTGAYPEERYIEDLGVTPDIPYQHTLEDFRNSYFGYVDAINAAAVSME